MSTDVILPIKVFNNVILANNQASDGVEVMFADNICVQFVWTGTPVGTFGISVSNDAVLTPYGNVEGGTWTPLVLTDPQPPTPNGTAGNGIINLTQIGSRFLQVTYVADTGTGTCTAILTAKSV